MFEREHLEHIWCKIDGLVHAVHLLTLQGDRMMTQLDDLTTSLTNIGAVLDSVATDVTDLKRDAATLATEVAALIAMLGTGGATDLTAVLAKATEIETRVAAINGDLAGVDSFLKAIPPAPGALNRGA